MDTAELISVSDFIKLKNTVDAEINRRSNTKSVGNMASYLQKYTNTPTSKNIINIEHIQKITQELDAITGNNTTPSRGSNILSLTLSTATASVGNLSGISVTSSNTGCKSSCSGLCSTGCYSSCTGCGNNCTGSCTGDCKESCSGRCSGCSGDCDGCEGTCENQCTGGCGDLCDQNCYPTCSSGCYGGCQGGDCGSVPLFL